MHELARKRWTEEKEMLMRQEPVIECIYGWGQMATLYRNRLEVNGSVYNLSDLMYVEPIDYRFMWISSIRLKLFFRQKMLVLCGLANNDPVQEMIAYLTSCICSPSEATIGLPETFELKTTQSLPQQSHITSSQGAFWDYNWEEGRADAVAPTDLLELYGEWILPEIVYLPEYIV
jgi:hypothetical protein